MASLAADGALTPEERERGETAMKTVLEEQLADMKTYTVEETVRFEEMCLKVESIASDIIKAEGNVVDLPKRVVDAYPTLLELAEAMPEAFRIFCDPKLKGERSKILEFLHVMRCLAKGEISRTAALDNITLLQYDGNEEHRTAMYELGVRLNSGRQ